MITDFMMVKSAIFGYRNAEKTEDGHIGRAAVVVGQAKRIADGVFERVSVFDNGIGKSARAASEALQTAKKSDAVIRGFGNFANMCSKNINPLIVASSVLDVAFAEDKKDAAVHSATALTTMFTAEHFMNKVLEKPDDIKCLKSVKQSAEKLFAKSDSKLLKKIPAKLPALIAGVAFAVGSCLSYDAGDKLGDVIMGKDKKCKSECYA